MRAGLIALVAVIALPAAPASAQEPAACEGPALDALVVAPDALSGRPVPFRAGGHEHLTFATRDATRLTVDWPDGTRTIAAVDGGARRSCTRSARRAASRSSPSPATPAATRRPGAFTITVRAPCALARDASIQATDCDPERGLLELSQAGVETGATWLSSGCNDVAFPEQRVPPRPIARAACVASPGPPPVAGRLPIREGRVVLLRLGAPARRVDVALGGPNRRRTRFARARAIGPGRRVFRVRVGRVVGSTRFWVVVRRAGGDDTYVAGLRVTQSS
jgi:hypothetical protein